MKVRHSRAARRQISEIWRYSAPLWGEKRADEYLRAIDAAIRDVAEGRRSARPCDHLLAGLTRVSVGSHHVYFMLDRKNDVLHVVVVLHQRMDPSRHLTDE